MGLSKSQIFQGWLSQRNEYEKTAWEIFKKIRIAQNPTVDCAKPGLVTWGWDFCGIDDQDVMFKYDNYGDHEEIYFPNDLLYDAQATKEYVQNIINERQFSEEYEEERIRKSDLEELQRLKDKYADK
jgi:hypothetical protein